MNNSKATILRLLLDKYQNLEYDVEELEEKVSVAQEALEDAENSLFYKKRKLKKLDQFLDSLSEENLEQYKPFRPTQVATLKAMGLENKVNEQEKIYMELAEILSED